MRSIILALFVALSVAHCAPMSDEEERALARSLRAMGDALEHTADSYQRGYQSVQPVRQQSCTTQFVGAMAFTNCQ